jgi:hypothetical protein
VSRPIKTAFGAVFAKAFGKFFQKALRKAWGAASSKDFKLI